MESRRIHGLSSGLFPHSTGGPPHNPQIGPLPHGPVPRARGLRIDPSPGCQEVHTAHAVQGETDSSRGL